MLSGIKSPHYSCLTRYIGLNGLYLKHCLVDAAERWADVKSKGNGEIHPDIVKSVSDEIETTINERHELVPSDLQKVRHGIIPQYPTDHDMLLVCQEMVPESGKRNCPGR